MEVVVARCAGLDVHKDTVMAAVRTPGHAGGRVEDVRQFSAFTSGLEELRDWLVAREVTQVAMEATGVYWRPVWHVLDDVGFELLLVNAHHVKRVPGRKTDVSDAAWLAQLLECGLLRGSFVPPPVIAQLRDLTRYRKKLIQERVRETQRMQKVLEDANIKLDSVASNVLGVSGRLMLDALVAGSDSPDALAELARGRLRAKDEQLRLALKGRVTSHHRFMLRVHLERIDQLTSTIDQLDEEVSRVVAPFGEQLERLCTIPGIRERTAQVVIAEIGVDMSRFPTAQHLASWAGLCPGNNESAGKHRSGRARPGDGALRTALIEAAWAAVRVKDSYLQAQFRRFARRFGKNGQNKALFAVAHSMLVIVWNMLATGTDYTDLGGDYFQRHDDTAARTRRLVRQLEQLGHTVQLNAA